MKDEMRFDKLAAVWKRVEAARERPAGSAPLMPRKKSKGRPLRGGRP